MSTKENKTKLIDEPEETEIIEMEESNTLDEYHQTLKDAMENKTLLNEKNYFLFKVQIVISIVVTTALISLGVFFTFRDINFRLSMEEVRLGGKYFESNVMNEQKDFDLINDAIKERFGKGIKSLNKIYDAKKDGDSAEKFHSLCDKVNNTLTLIKSQDNKRFGGFTSASWEAPKDGSVVLYKSDKNAFVFSFTEQQIYGLKDWRFAISCDKTYGPTFGFDHDIHLPNNFMHEKIAYSIPYYHRANNYNSSESLDKSGIDLEEVEVYEVIFEEK